ncbi:MAG TPA: flagellar basal body-associated FliL family protein [Syntrophorhabdaceae bacterium]|nr:flagellar basal body-associated FliL family protein [Syntrophorhabdaceae bacterium]
MPEEVVQEKEVTEEPKKKKGKFKILLIIIFCVICLGLAGTYFLYGNVLIERFLGKESSEEQKKEVKKAEVPTGPIMSLEPFLFNISNAPGRYAKISISIQFKDKKAMEEAQKITPALRDKILTVLGFKGMDVLMDVDNRNVLRQEIHNSLKNLFHKETDIVAIYITDIMIQ